MTRWKGLLDRQGTGTHYADRLHRILGVCRDCGLLWHNERVRHRDGVVETRRVDDIAPTDSVLVTPRYEKYGLQVNPSVLTRLTSLGHQFSYALNVSGVSVEVDGNVVYVRVPRADGEQDEAVPFEVAWEAAPGSPSLIPAVGSTPCRDTPLSGAAGCFARRRSVRRGCGCWPRGSAAGGAALPTCLWTRCPSW